MLPGVDVRRGCDRATTRSPYGTTRHAFSSGAHYDPSNASYGRLVAHDEHLLPAGAGFPEHLHRELELVTWVLEGTLVHRDDCSGERRVRPGEVQVLTAGTGVRHSELAAHDGPVRLVQSWLLPERPDAAPAYRSAAVDVPAGRLVRVTSGDPSGAGAAALALAVPAVLSVGRLAPGDELELPPAAGVHLHVARGEVDLLAHADTVRLRGGDAVRLTAVAARLRAQAPAEVLVWELPAS